MSIRRFSHLFLLLLLSLSAYAQPYWQKGTVLESVGGSAFVTGTTSNLTNARLTLQANSCSFITPKVALGLGASTDLSPLTQTYATMGRVHFLASGASDQKFSLLLDVHAGLAYHTSQTVTGGSFSSSDMRAGLGAQCTWWVSQSTGIYLWPQLDKTNGGPSGLWEWQLMLPIGVQWNWHKHP